MQLPNLTPNHLGSTGAVGGIQPGGSSGNAQKAGGRTNGELPFADLVKGLIEDTSNRQHQVDESVEKMVSGETDSIHDVVMTASRADLAFRLVMEIRNRMISSYQEIMRMQV